MLIIDDDADIRLFAAAVLETAGHQVLTAADPMKGISLLSIADIDALVLDVVMPRFTGFELLEILRRDSRNRMLPVLLLSALTETQERMRGMTLGATDFLPKPFDPEELVRRVERVVDHRFVSPGGLSGAVDEAGLIRALQALGEEARSGTFRLTSERRHGWIELDKGRLVAASYGLLEGAESILSMLSLEAGRFRFEPSLETKAPAAKAAPELLLSRLVARHSQLEQELASCADELPTDRAGLYVARELTTDAYSTIDLPFAEIYERIYTLPGVTIAELIAHEFVAAIKVRLAVAALARAAVIEAVIEGTGFGSGSSTT